MLMARSIPIWPPSMRTVYAAQQLMDAHLVKQALPA